MRPVNGHLPVFRQESSGRPSDGAKNPYTFLPISSEAASTRAELLIDGREGCIVDGLLGRRIAIDSHHNGTLCASSLWRLLDLRNLR